MSNLSNNQLNDSGSSSGWDDPIAPPPVPVLPYATAFQFQAERVWREQATLVMAKGSPLPPRCVKCNAPADAKPWRKTLYWHHPAWYAVILVNILVYAMVAMVVRKSVKVTAGLCPAHRAARRRKLLIAWLLALIGIGLIASGIDVLVNLRSDDPSEGLLLVLGGFASIIVGALFGKFAAVLRAKKIDATYAWLDGAGPDFLSNFPCAGVPQ